MYKSWMHGSRTARTMKIFEQDRHFKTIGAASGAQLREIARENVDTMLCQANDTPWGNNPWLVIRVGERGWRWWLNYSRGTRIGPFLLGRFFTIARSRLLARKWPAFVDKLAYRIINYKLDVGWIKRFGT